MAFLAAMSTCELERDSTSAAGFDEAKEVIITESFLISTL